MFWEGVIFHLLLDKSPKAPIHFLKSFELKLMIFARLETKFYGKSSSELKMAASNFGCVPCDLLYPINPKRDSKCDLEFSSMLKYIR
jgi:hypothetical protein